MNWLQYRKTLIAQCVIDGIALLIVVNTLLQTRKRQELSGLPRKSYSLLRWLLVALLIVFSFLVANYALLYSSTYGQDGANTHLSTVITVFDGLGRLFVLLLIGLLGIAVFESTSGEAPTSFIAKIVNFSFFAIVAILWIPALALYLTIIYSTYSGIDFDLYHKYIGSEIKLWKAYYIMYLISSVLALGFLTSAMLSSAARYNLMVQAKIWLSFTTMMFLVYNIAIMIGVFGYDYGNLRSTVGSVITLELVNSIPLSLTAFGISRCLHTLPSIHQPGQDTTYQA